jgi:hypothetical protein
MKGTDKIFSHVRRDELVQVKFGKPIRLLKESERTGYFSISEIRKSKGTKADSFSFLARMIAEIGYHNHKYNLLFRGQSNDDKDKNGRTKIYPSIYRPEGQRLSKHVSTERFQNLKKAITALSKARDSLGVHSILKNHNEYYIALLQHYQLLRTPMLDLTSSLLVAASFALEKGRTGYLFVFGMPHPQGSISHYIDDGLVLVKLQNVCPPEALRPHFQEAYLVGKLPINSIKEAEDNFGRRLIGKFFLDNSGGDFWRGGFKQISKKVLYSSHDTYLEQLKTILNLSA